MADMVSWNQRSPDYDELKLDWRAILLMVVGTAIAIALFLAFGNI
jgi:hypothetical protein